MKFPRAFVHSVHVWTVFVCGIVCSFRDLLERILAVALFFESVSLCTFPVFLFSFFFSKLEYSCITTLHCCAQKVNKLGPCWCWAGRILLTLQGTEVARRFLFRAHLWCEGVTSFSPHPPCKRHALATADHSFLQACLTVNNHLVWNSLFAGHRPVRWIRITCTCRWIFLEVYPWG